MAMFKSTIGLEIHAELRTKTKMFCESKNDPDETSPNVNVCPVCMAHPGTLPVINHEAVRHVLRIGTAIGGTLADFSEFDRKSYFYPDIPKGYQISQYQYPLVQGGALAGVAITRVHLEEDTARSIHTAGKSLVDFNRAGIPLMELVTEPVIHDALTAGRFARELQLLLRTLGAGEANLEKGEMRIEANVSISKHEARSTKSEADSNGEDSKQILGTKVEVKNINSFRAVERAIAYEIERQTKLIEEGGKVVQETRGWDEGKQVTFHQRFKEGSADYRYFPEPDLPKLRLREMPEFSVDTLRASLPELPWARRARYIKDYGLSTDAISFISATVERSTFFDSVISELGNVKEAIVLAASFMTTDLAGIYAKRGEESYENLNPRFYAKLIRMFASTQLSSRGAKDTLALFVESGADPETIAHEQGLVQIHDTDALAQVVDAILAEEQKAVQEYASGKQAALQYLVGKAMKKSRGAGNPEILRQLLTAKLSTKS